MKKIFLLSLLSVFFLSAFSQVAIGDAEIITKININRSSPELGQSSYEGNLGGETGWWIFFWNTVISSSTPEGGVSLQCSGWGWKFCTPKFDRMNCPVQGVSSEAVEKTCENIVTESDELAAHGEYKGSITKKVAYNDPQANGRVAYLIYQMNWDYDPSNPRNGKAEIIISKTKNLGINY